MRFRNRQVYIYTDLKWSSQYQNAWSLMGYLDQSGARKGILRPIWHCWDHFRSLPIWWYLFHNPILVCKYLSPLISNRIGSVFKIFICILVFRNKNGLEICFFVPEILNKSYSCIFFKHPVWLFILKSRVWSGLKLNGFYFGLGWI